MANRSPWTGAARCLTPGTSAPPRTSPAPASRSPGTPAAKADITKRELTGSFTAANKVYDGNRQADISSRDLNGVLEGEQVSLSGGSALFDTKHVVTAKTVTGTGFTLAGDDRGNYQLASSTLAAKADITAKT